MLTQEETDLVTGMLLDLVSPQAAPRQVLVAGLYPELQAQFDDGPPLVLVSRAICLCIQDAYSHDPPALVLLLRTLLGARERIPEIIARVIIPPPASEDQFAALILDSKLPFLDRPLTRRYLKALLQNMPVQPVVIINGGSKLGKSYTCEFIDHLCGRLDGVQHCIVELADEQGASTGLCELARDIVARIGGDLQDAPPRNTNLDRWAQDMANWIISEATKSKIRWWIVLDGFNNQELRDDTRLLIRKLANSLTTGVSRRLHRLILTDFDGAILTLQPGKIASETTGGIPKTAVAAFVSQVLMGAPRLDAAKITDSMLGDLPDPVMDLPELNRRLSGLISIVEERDL